MADTVTEEIIQSVITALENGEGKPNPLGVNRSRRQPQEIGELPIVNVFLMKETVDQPRGNPNGVHRTLAIMVRIWHHAKSGVTDSLIEPIREYVVRVVLGALGRYGLEISTEWAGEDVPETHVAVVDVQFVVTYATRRGLLAERLK
jgi:hypothetical protein